MCDEAKLKDWASSISRRDFGVLAGGAAMVAACSGPDDVMSGPMVDEDGKPLFGASYHAIETSEGSIDAVLVAPVQGKHPGVIFWPDIASIRDSKIAMAHRLASEGYAVLIMNPYYRDVPKNQFADFAEFIEADGFSKVRPWREKLTADAIGRDAAAAVRWLDAQESVDTSRGIGTQGYCMGGPFTVWSAASVPDRIKAAASFHGGGLVRADDPLSPHRTLDRAEAAFLIAVAQDDDAQAPQVKDDFAAAAEEAGRSAKVEVYAGDHGWTVPDSPAYAEPAAEQAYADLLELYSGNL
ncbi:dienelactone hydrolase family protein [uncultured Erythrobacter sp.]|uniref:dienelactone hydrolase family protein n=1 Tax=uncultured Erythrobacter sp. TaxID=263913 RepID=UPI002626ACF2|nr:dienelactone hydrolase family protein [uncultured Erythrobacter sp.]